jgi:chromosome segregation ATPase
MPSQKGRGGPKLQDILNEMRGHGVILEDIRSQNRATIEAVEATRAALEERIDRVDRDSQARDADLGTAVRSLRKSVEQNSADIQHNSADIRQNSEDIRQNTADIRQNTADIRDNSADIVKNGEDIRTLTARVDALGSLDQRVSALERRSSQ